MSHRDLIVRNQTKRRYQKVDISCRMRREEAISVHSLSFLERCFNPFYFLRFKTFQWMIFDLGFWYFIYFEHYDTVQKTTTILLNLWNPIRSCFVVPSWQVLYSTKLTTSWQVCYTSKSHFSFQLESRRLIY